LFLHYNIEKAGNDGFPVEDEFLRILRTTNETNEVSLEMAFAAQVFLDIRHVLGDEMMAEETIECMVEMKFGLDTFIRRWGESLSPGFIDPLRPQIAKGVEFLTRILRDIIPEVRAYHVRNGLDVEGSDEPWRFFKRSPVLCDLALFHARAEIYKLSVACMKFTGITTCLTHLYNAIQQESLLDKPWVDLEAFEACFDEQDLFWGGKAKDPTKYYKRLLAQMGASLTTLERRGRESWRMDVTNQHPRDTTWRQAVRGMERGAPVSNAYLRMYKQRGGCVDMTKDEVYEIASLSKYKLVVEDGQCVFVSLSMEEKQQLNKRTFQPKSKHPTQKGPWPVSYFLLLLTHTLAAEARELAFPCLRMHDDCFLFRHELFDRCKRVLEEKVLFAGAMPIRQTSDIITHALFLIDCPCPGGDAVLKEAAAAIREACDKYGDGKLKERIQGIKSFSQPVPVAPVVSHMYRTWYLGDPSGA
jgi:hypothetical protein